MKAQLLCILGLTTTSLLAGCATTTPTALAPVGPATAEAPSSARHGYLQVFTATEKSIPFASDDTALFNLHMSYDIYDTNGKRVKYVSNHMGNMDEWPDLVQMPAGQYRIEGESTWCGLVSVPVTVENGKTTVVHLDGNWFPPKQTASNQLVYLPNGAAVGWKSNAGTVN